MPILSFPDIPGLYSSAAALVRTQVAALHENEGERLTVERARETDREGERLSSASPDYFGMKAGLLVLLGGFCSRAFTKLAGGQLKFRARDLSVANVFACGSGVAHPICNEKKQNELGMKKASPVISF